jgi:hypothetical protein
VEGRASWIEDDLAGLKHDDVGAGVIGTDGVGAAGDLEDVVRGGKGGYAIGHLDVEGIGVGEVATPGNGGAA